MMTSNEGPMIKRNACLSCSEGSVYVPQQLLEANELLTSITRRLEDCALEWQAKISQKQWKIFNSNAVKGNSLEQCLLTRTYFPEKNLDEAFQHLLSCNKIFSEYLKNFIALLRGEQPVLNVKETRDAQNQCSNTSDSWKELNDSNNESISCSSLRNEHLTDTRKPENLRDNILLVQNSFTDVIKAKVNFDTKFLGFEAVLHKTISSPINTVCLCQYCSRTMTSHGGHKKLGIININQRNRTITKPKRLTRSTKSFFKNQEMEQPPLSIGDAGDRSSYGAKTTFC
ncbi:uncharacterized protein LOC143184621 [Calliopsis andreniformis]|uniref:uncharacterized protein LOC143184621 n=1 Tax=Calliopsis andreniformis TaxID=337506 RepID=UPI003FCD381D